MAQHLGSFVALAVDPSLVPNNVMVVHKHPVTPVAVDLLPLSHPFGYQALYIVHIHADQTLKINLKRKPKPEYCVTVFINSSLLTHSLTSCFPSVFVFNSIRYCLLQKSFSICQLVRLSLNIMSKFVCEVG